MPGLFQKYYLKLDKPKHYGAVHLWTSREALIARIRSLMAFLYDELGDRADLWSGRSASTDARNFIKRTDW